MIIKLPIKLNDKIINESFNVIIENDEINVLTLNNKNYIDIIYTNNYGINYYPIYFPLKFLISDDCLINEYFFIISIICNKDITNANFFYLLLNHINKKSKLKYKFINSDKINMITIDKIINKINSNFIFNVKNTQNIKSDILLKNIYNKYQYYLNISLALIYINNNSNNKTKPSKRVKQCIRQILNTNINFYGYETTIENHLCYIHTNKIKEEVLDLNKYIFIEDILTNKILRLKIKNIDAKYIYIDNYKLKRNTFRLYHYPPKFKNVLTVKNIFNKLISNVDLLQIIKIIFKNNNDYNNLIEYFINVNNIILINSSLINNSIKSVQHVELFDNLICDDSISYEYFIKSIEKKDFDIDILKNILKYYTYPLNYSKNDFTVTFKKILYFLNKHYNKFTENKKLYDIFNSKYRNLFSFIISFYEKYNKDDINIIYNQKIYTDNLYFLIIYIQLSDNYKLFEQNKTFYKFKKEFISNIKLYQIIKFLNWNNFKYNIKKLEFLCENKNNKFIFYENKISKNINLYFDSKLCKVIHNPFFMCNYLLKKKDFIKWVLIFKNHINLLYVNTIKIKKNEYEKIGKILYYISKIEEQNLSNKNYSEIISFLSINSRLIIFNNRININIKEIFCEKNINLGYLSKHILNANTDSIVFSDSEYDITLDELSEKYKSTQKKYFKYKSKYLELKTSELSSNFQN